MRENTNLFRKSLNYLELLMRVFLGKGPMKANQYRVMILTGDSFKHSDMTNNWGGYWMSIVIESEAKDEDVFWESKKKDVGFRKWFADNVNKLGLLDCDRSGGEPYTPDGGGDYRVMKGLEDLSKFLVEQRKTIKKF